MRVLHLQAFLLALGLAGNASQPQEESEAGARESSANTRPPEADEKLGSPLERARRLTSRWKEMRYAIFSPLRNLGEYHQKNTLRELQNGRVFLEFKDSIRLYRNDDPVEYMTECAVSGEFELLKVSGRFGIMGEASVRFRNGTAFGENSNTGELSMKTPEHLISPMVLLRGLRHQSLAKGESVEWDNFNIEGAPRKVALQEVKLTYMGDEEVVAQGITYFGKSYRLNAGKRKQVFYWFGADGQLLKVQDNQQTWELMPPDAKKPLPVKRKRKKPKPVEQETE